MSIYYNDINVGNLFINLANSIKNSLNDSGMLISVNGNSERTYKKPWYKKSCITVRKHIDKHLKILKQHNFAKDHLMTYNISKKNYKAVVQKTKKRARKYLVKKDAKC